MIYDYPALMRDVPTITNNSNVAINPAFVNPTIVTMSVNIDTTGLITLAIPFSTNRNIIVEHL